jgi:Secretion system C-terminal sorting domain/Two component regulator propeller
MRRSILMFLFTVFAFPDISAQNGTTVIAMPTFFSLNSLRTKNDITVDSTGNVWLAMKDNGVFKWNQTAWEYFNTNDGLCDNYIRCVFADTNNTLWFGSDTGGVSMLHNNQWQTLNRWNSPIPSGRVFDIYRQGDTLWMGTDRGIAAYTSSGWTIYNRSNSGLPSDTIYSITKSVWNEIVLGSPKGIVHFFGNNFYNFWIPPTTLPVVTQVYTHHDGTLWCIADKQLFRLGNTGLQNYSVNFEQPGVNWDGVSCVGRGPRGGLAFSALKGQLNEIIGQRIITYYPFGVNSNPQTSRMQFASDPVGQQFWNIESFVGSNSSPLIDLKLFDPASYCGIGLGVTGDNYKFIDGNNLKAAVHVRGDLHWDLTAQSEFFAPKNTNKAIIFASGVWVGGLDDQGELHQAAATYRQSGYDYYPGPGIAGIDSLQAQQFDRIWNLTAQDIATFQYQWSIGAVQNQTWIPPTDLLDWPAKGNNNLTYDLAPFADVNGNGIYDPMNGGDYPLIKGDEAVYFVINDRVGPHTFTQTPALGVQISAMIYGYHCTSPAGTVAENTLFYEYTYINRSDSAYHDAYFTFWHDMDLGNWQDDYVGCIPEQNALIIYNGDSIDEPIASLNTGTYGNRIPVVSIAVVDGPLAPANDGNDNNNNGITDEPGEQSLMNYFVSYATGSPNLPYGGMTNNTDYYNYSRGVWKDSSSVTYGGNGYGNVLPTRFMFPDLPTVPNGWHEPSANQIPGDRAALLSSGPFYFQPGDSLQFTYAITFHVDSIHPWNSAAYYQTVTDNLTTLHNLFASPNTPCFPLGIMDHAPSTVSAFEVYPNPTDQRTTIMLHDAQGSATVRIYSSTGLLINEFIIKGSIQLSTAELQQGIYFIQVITPTTAGTQPLIIQR